MWIKITEKYLNKAVKAGSVTSSTRCPIARALRDAGFKDVRVGNDSWEVYLDNIPVKLSERARTFTQFCFTYGYAQNMSHKERIKKLAYLRFLLPFKIQVPKPS